MKILQINSFSNGSTGKIMFDIHNYLSSNGIDSYVVWARGRGSRDSHELSINDNWGIRIHGIYTRLFDKHGFASWSATRHLISHINDVEPDIIHIHNIHGYYLNIEILFDFLKKYGKPVVWTLHDCWPFTGHCAYFESEKCNKWRIGCYKCPQKSSYPKSIFADRSRDNWLDKRKVFEYQKLKIVCPSKWLANYCKQSFLGKNSISVINNGIDCGIFRYYEDTSSIFAKYGLGSKPIILGVASEWTERKGLRDLYRIQELTNNYQVVVVGLNDDQYRTVPEGIVGLKRTENQQQLAMLYSGSKVLFNPTYEDNYPTVNLEAQACKTPVVTYKTGGSIESVPESNVVNQGDVEGALRKIEKGELRLGNVELNKNHMAHKYYELYKEIHGD